MKFYEFIESLQRLNPNKIIMIKTGAFFNSIGRDAIILELNGDNITETRKNTDCNKCKNNLYRKDTNTYTIKQENYEKLAKRVEEFLDSIKEILNIKK